MSIYLSDHERDLVNKQRAMAPLNRFWWELQRRVATRAATPGLIGNNTSVEWWHAAQEYMTDAAMVYAVQPDDTIGRWLRDATLSVVRRSADDWAGPWFRDHETQPLQGHLETAHLSVAVAVALDLAAGIFTPAENDEIRTVLRDTAIPQCTNWLDRARHFNNWRCVLTAGLTAAAVVTGDKKAIARAVAEVNTCCQAYYGDGSHSESLQYSGYASFSLMLAYESLARYDAALAGRISPLAYGKAVRWIAHSFFYLKPLTGWGEYPRPRSANFNDSAAIYRPSGDWLMHVATRLRSSQPAEAGLARWLFDLLYAPDVARTPNDRATFGFVNDFGFLTLPLLPQAAAAVSPEEAGLGMAARYNNGDAFARQTWSGRTLLAVRTASDPMPGPSHLHGDVNSFILVHNKERLLLDAGHSCYRNLIRELDVASASHNTCTFVAESESAIRRAEDVEAAVVLQQKTGVHRSIRDGQLGPLVERGGRFLLAAESGPVKVIGSDAAGLYGAPIQSFQRFCILLGEHVLFVVDSISAARPVRTTWNWLLNNRDGGLDLKIVRPDRLVARRGNAALKLFHLGGATLSGPVYAYVHDAYHPLPNQDSEGKSGSGMLMRWSERTAQTARTVLHAIAVDDYGTVAGWHLRKTEAGTGLEGPGGSPAWFIETSNEPLTITVREKTTGASYRVAEKGGVWTLTQLT